MASFFVLGRPLFVWRKDLLVVHLRFPDEDPITCFLLLRLLLFAPVLSEVALSFRLLLRLPEHDPVVWIRRLPVYSCFLGRVPITSYNPLVLNTSASVFLTIFE